MASTDLLIVEGPNDVHVFVHLLKHYGLPLSEPGLDEPEKISLAQGEVFSNFDKVYVFDWRLRE